MLKARVHADLPSVETQRAKGPIEWVRSLLGAKLDLRSGKEELTVSALSLVEGLSAAFQRAGITNAISLLVDKKVIYLDTQDTENDLPLIAHAAEVSGVLDRPFKEMHLVMSHKEAGVHTLIDVRIANQVVLGGEELTIELSGRVEELRVQNGETAQQYAERVRGFAREGERMEVARLALGSATGRPGARWQPARRLRRCGPAWCRTHRRGAPPDPAT